jgi:hypothetical protein
MLLMLRSTTVGPRVVYVVDVSPGNLLNAWKSFHVDRYEACTFSSHHASSIPMAIIHVASHGT